MFEQKILDQITVNTHSSIRIGGKTVIYIDPIQIAGTPHDADLVLITHPHFDHFSPRDIKKVMKADTVIACPKSFAALCKLLTGKDAVAVVPGQRLSLSDVPVETVAAYNRRLPAHAKFFKWVGYVLNIDGTRIYISGDTDNTAEARAVACDIAMIPIGGTYTVNASQAAALVNTIAPHTVIPLHYGVMLGGQNAPQKFCAQLQQSIEADVRSGVYSKVMLRILPLIAAAVTLGIVFYYLLQ